MKAAFLYCFMWFAFMNAVAQSHPEPLAHPYLLESDSLLPPLPPPNLYLKTNLFSLTEPDMAATLAIEYRRNKKQAYQLEAGYIFLDALEEGTDLKHSGGFRLKPEWRFYTPGSPRKRTHYANYWAVEAIVKAVYNRSNHFVGRHCSSGNCAYFQEMDYRTTRNVVGIGGKMGREAYIGQEARRVVFDFYAGLGVRYRWLNNSLPPDANWQDDHIFLSILRPTLFLPYLSAGLKIGWRVK